jgi:hypothetical protein
MGVDAPFGAHAVAIDVRQSQPLALDARPADEHQLLGIDRVDRRPGHRHRRLGQGPHLRTQPGRQEAVDLAERADGRLAEAGHRR